VIVRDVDSQFDVLWTAGSELVKVTSHENVLVAVTLYVVLDVVWVVPDASFVSVNGYDCPLTAEPEPTPHVPSVKSAMVKVPFSAVPPAEVMVAESFGSQSWADVADVVSLTSTLPEVCSPVAGTGAPDESVPWPSAVQAVSCVGLNVQVKSANAPGASEATDAGVHVVQPVPVGMTPQSHAPPSVAEVSLVFVRPIAFER
jgi:hypothetical protein